MSRSLGMGPIQVRRPVMVDYSENFGLTVEDLKSAELPFRHDLFAGQVVVVSGAGSGIGKAIAFVFGRLGASLAICGRNIERLEACQRELGEIGVRVLAVPLSIREPAQVSDFMEAVWAEYGRIDHLINNAGGHFAQPALDFSEKGWRAVIDTNLSGTWFMMQQAAKRWVTSDTSGSIVNIVLDVWRGIPGIAHGCAARGGVISLSMTLAIEWAPYRLRVNCIAPGVIETTGYNQYTEENRRLFVRANPQLRAGSALDVAQACIYLSAAQTGSFITGEVLTIDGGQQLWGDLWMAGRPAYFDDT